MKHTSTEVEAPKFGIDDVIGFDNTAALLERTIRNLDGMPFSIAINSPWGTGKTHFLKMWSAQLTENDWAHVSFNAWENDFLVDPLSCLVSEMSLKLSDDPNSKSYLPTIAGMRDALFYLGKAAAPALLKSLIPAASMVSDAVNEIAPNAVEEAAKESLNNISTAKAQLTRFRIEFGELAKAVKKETGKPLVVLIDELDRCRPDFALKMLEVIKHLFQAENAVFVFAIAGEQLIASTQAVYGPNFDGEQYLHRFSMFNSHFLSLLAASFY